MHVHYSIFSENTVNNALIFYTLAKSSDEDAIAKRFGVHSRPTLLFLRGTQYMTTIVGILDWDVYVPRFGEALATPTQRAPISIANVTPNTSCVF